MTHHDLGRPGRHVDPNQCLGIVLHQHLGRGDPLIPRSEDLVDLGTRFSSISHGGDRLSSTRLENDVDADEFGDVQDFWGNGTVRSGRSSEDDGGASSHLRRDPEHERGGRQDGGTSRNVDSDSVNGPSESSTNNAGHGFHHQRFLFRLAEVERLDIRVGLFDGVDDLARKLLARRRRVKGGEEDVGFEVRLVKLLGQRFQRLVPTFTDLRDDRLDALDHSRRVHDRSLQ